MAAVVQMDGAGLPKGNFVARSLRLMNDNSKELFPRTPAEAKPTKFHSMYKKDYTEYPTDVVLEGLAPKVGDSLLLLLLYWWWWWLVVVVVALHVQEGLHGVPH